MSNIKEEFKEFIVSELENRIGNSYYACDLASYITEGINADGSVTYSTYEAKEWIKENWDLCAESYENQKFNWGIASVKNPFEEPEAFMVCVYIDIIEQILSRCPTINDNWDDEIELTKEVIEKLKGEIDAAIEEVLEYY